MWLVSSAAVLLSIPLMGSIEIGRRPREASVAPEAGPVSASMRPAARG